MKQRVRHEVFMLQYNKEDEARYEEILHASRVTLTELFLVKAISSAHANKSNLQEAVTLINNQIKSWSSVQIRTEHIDSKVWHFAQQVTSGKQPTDADG